MDPTTAIDLYCERTAPGLLAEPLNALSNLAFFVAAFALWRLARRERATGAMPALLIGLVALIGAGSGAFHVFANRATLLADVIPISLFQLVFLGAYARGVMGWSRRAVAALLGLFLAVSVAAEGLPAGWLNGSLGYAPAVGFVAWLGVAHWRARRAEPAVLLWAAGVFVLSLALRTVDNAWCEAWPMGTHWAWHLLNGGVLYLAVRGYLVGRR